MLISSALHSRSLSWPNANWGEDRRIRQEISADLHNRFCEFSRTFGGPAFDLKFVLRMVRSDFESIPHSHALLLLCTNCFVQLPCPLCMLQIMLLCCGVHKSVQLIALLAGLCYFSLCTCQVSYPTVISNNCTHVSF